MKHFDAVVIGGGVLGCFAARNLCRYNLNAALLESGADVCTGITRANASICYAGYDHAPGSAKATFTVAANAAMDALCGELEVPFRRCGSLMTASGPKGEATLRKKLEQGNIKGVPGLQLLTGEQAREREPMLGPNVTAALYAPTTGTLNPWQLGIAAFENAVHNGCTPMLNTPVRNIRRSGKDYLIETDGEEITCSMVINCAGLYADRVQEMLFLPRVRLYSDASDFVVFRTDAPSPRHILFQEQEKGKGMSAIPTTDGNLMLESPARPTTGEAFAVSPDSFGKLRRLSEELLPGLDWSGVIRSFGALRPNARQMVMENGQWVPDSKNIPSFVIDRPEPGFLSFIGIKTPGLTCADQLGMHAAKICAEYLNAKPNPGFDPRRKAITRLHGLDFETREALVRDNPDYGHIICRCQNISKGEVMEAISRGAATADAVRRRLGTGMGPCQGSRCSRTIEKILGEYCHGNC